MLAHNRWGPLAGCLTSAAESDLQLAPAYRRVSSKDMSGWLGAFSTAAAAAWRDGKSHDLPVAASRQAGRRAEYRLRKLLTGQRLFKVTPVPACCGTALRSYRPRPWPWTWPQCPAPRPRLAQHTSHALPATRPHASLTCDAVQHRRGLTQQRSRLQRHAALMRLRRRSGRRVQGGAALLRRVLHILGPVDTSHNT